MGRAKKWPVLPRMNPCLPCMVGNPAPVSTFPIEGQSVRRSGDHVVGANPRKKRGCATHIDMPYSHAHIDMPGAHAATGAGSHAHAIESHGDNPRSRAHAACERDLAECRQTARVQRGVISDLRDEVFKQRKPRKNPKLMVLNPCQDTLAAQIERQIGRRLSSREKGLLSQAIRDFKVFHQREPKASDLIPVDVPPGTPLIVSAIGRLDRINYTVDFPSERKGKWTHKAGDHGRTKTTRPPFLVSVPGRSKHNYVIAQQAGAKTYFKRTHGLMG